MMVIEKNEFNGLGRKPSEHYDHRTDQASKDKTDLKVKVFLYLGLLMLFTLFVYLIRPLAWILQVMFLTDPHKTQTSEDGSESSSTLLYLIGWLIMFITPLYHFFVIGSRIIILQQSIFMKIWATIVILAECIFGVPLTFLHSSNLYSIYLFQERGINQLINSWLVFFPTEYMTNWYEIGRNVLEGLYFIVVGGIKYGDLKSDLYSSFSLSVILTMIILNVIKLLGFILLIVFRLFRIVDSLRKKEAEQAENEEKEK